MGGRRILLGDNTDGGAAMLRPNGLKCAGVWISTELPCTYIQSDPHAEVPTCAKFDWNRTFRNESVSVEASG